MTKNRKAKKVSGKRVNKPRRAAVHGRHLQRKKRDYTLRMKTMVQNGPKEFEEMNTSMAEQLSGMSSSPPLPPAPMASTPIVAYNGQMEAGEAAKVLGCSYSHLINLLKAKKLKAQQRDRRWFVESDDVYKAKNSGMVRPRGLKNGKVKHIPVPARQNSFVRQAVVDPVIANGDKAVLKLEIDRAKLDVIRIAFQGKDKDLMKYMHAQIDALYSKIQEQLSKVKF